MNSNPRLRCSAILPVVGQGRARVGVAKAFLSEFFEEPHIERATHALAAVVRIDIGRDLDRPTVGGTFAVRRSVGVSDALTVVLGHEPLPTCQGFGNASGELLDRGNDGFKRDRSCLDEGTIDGQKSGASASVAERMVIGAATRRSARSLGFSRTNHQPNLSRDKERDQTQDSRAVSREINGTEP